MEVSAVPPQVGGCCFPEVESQVDQDLVVAPDIFVDQSVNGLLIGTTGVMLQSLRAGHNDVPPRPPLLLPVQNIQIQRNFSGLTGTEAHMNENQENMDLSLQDNPWFCDCHISKMIELSKVVDPAIVLLDPLMICSEPERLTGILFQRAELEHCLKPSVMTSATKIMSALGSNVLLRCDATGFPTPQLTWTRSDSSPVNYTVIQEAPEEGVRWSIMSLTGISAKDAGDYKCKAKNLAGMSEAVVTVTVLGIITTTISPDASERTGDHPEWEVQPGSGRSTSVLNASPYPWSSSFPPTSSLSASTLSPPSTSSFSLSPSFSSTASSTTTLSTSISASTTMANKRSLQLHPDGKRNLKAMKSGSKLPPASTSKKEELALLDQTLLIETNATIENLRVISETKESVTLRWNMINTTHNSAVTVLYSKYGGKDLLLLNADSSKNQVTIDGLEPGGQYMACVCPKGVPPQKDQCITFSTERPRLWERNSFLVPKDPDIMTSQTKKAQQSHQITKGHVAAIPVSLHPPSETVRLLKGFTTPYNACWVLLAAAHEQYIQIIGAYLRLTTLQLAGLEACELWRDHPDFSAFPSQTHFGPSHCLCTSEQHYEGPCPIMSAVTTSCPLGPNPDFSTCCWKTPSPLTPSIAMETGPPTSTDLYLAFAY
ncbi:hypothetical protein P7K49_006732 [Saguinus oedipus]|uniref:Leucine-rich repeat, immunoglobulin-like domain and transmembrane domain-containing protein 3 n=1 Tax=Saguinus oedipus TaxID=9490 RepID=A0ABQ9W410_SAGOE|nr:hypothetical protein P7K49_006732 [Saguinus oedipus]